MSPLLVFSGYPHPPRVEGVRLRNSSLAASSPQPVPGGTLSRHAVGSWLQPWLQLASLVFRRGILEDAHNAVSAEPHGPSPVALLHTLRQSGGGKSIQ